MARLFFTNLNFEQQLSGDRQTLPVDLEQRAAELVAGWLAVARPGDAAWCPLKISAEFWQRMADRGLPLLEACSEIRDLPKGLELVPWGWTEPVRRFARTVHANCEAPPQPAVVTANSRRFSLQLETCWNCGLDGAEPITSSADLEQAIRDLRLDERWVLKAEFGAAARQRIVCTGPVPDPNSSGWIRNRLAAGDWLVFEPWVERIAEAGLQWTIPPSGAPVLEGVTELLCDSAGQYTGSVFGLDAGTLARWSSTVEIARRAVADIQRLGYFGPVGIDAMRYRAADGSERIRPLQDINARWTMGRLALGWQRIMPRGVWRHGSIAEFSARAQAGPGMIRTSPVSIADRPARLATWLEPHVGD